MTWEVLTVLTVTLSLIGLLVFTAYPPDVLFVGAVTLLLVGGLLTPDEAFMGLSNPGMITVGVLYIVVAGLRRSGAIDRVATAFLGRPRTVSGAQLRIMLPVAGLSAVLNNTPVVAMLIPAIQDLAKRARLSLSRLLLPLSYAAILGGTWTLIGTSTNLVVDGMMRGQQVGTPLQLFDLAAVGVPLTIVGVAYVLLAGRWLLPDRVPMLRQLEDARQYSIEMQVPADSPLIGRSIEQAGLRQLPGMYLAEIERDGEVLAAVSPQRQLQAGDRLLFVGVVGSVADLNRLHGLVPATDQVFKLETARSSRRLVEAVVSPSCSIIGTSVREGRFRNRYNAVVIAVSRNGARIPGKVGDIRLRAGDALLLETHPSFVDQQRDSRDFLLVSPVEGSAPPRHERAGVALTILVAMVAAAGLGLLPMLHAVLLAAGAMLITGCVHASEARKAIDWQVLIVIAASFGLGTAIEKSGAATLLASSVLDLAAGQPWLTLAAVDLTTMILTELISNNAAALLVFPIAAEVARDLGVDFTPFAVTLMMAASASFSTPIGYQCNLMVYGPGGYRFTDYLRMGIPLNLLAGTVTVTLVPLIWKF